jgi:RND family efflux transporter MFP subunit
MTESELVAPDLRSVRETDAGALEVDRMNPSTPPPRIEPSRPWLPVAIGAGVVAIAVAGGLMFVRASHKTNTKELASEPKPVTVVEARAATYKPSRRYVATMQPWLSAKVGPQLVSAYVDTVLVRPGAVVKTGDVLATLDCRKDSADSQAIAMQAKSLEARQHAAAKEAARIGGMLDGGFVSENEAEKKLAESDAEQASLLSARAKLAGSALEVNDCILKAPFDGEISDRFIDPGAFVRPGTPIVGVVDRGTVRVVADVPESDFSLVAPGAQVRVRVIATGKSVTAAVSRRAPGADANTRTVHFEIDLVDSKREIPVGTTAELGVDAGEPTPAIELPLNAAIIRGDKATLFVLEGDVAKKISVPVKGESGGSVFLDLGALKPGAKVVTEGRALLNDGDKVRASLAVSAATGASSAPGATSASQAPAAASGSAKR